MLVSTKENTCTTFGTHKAVHSASKRRNISNGREISLNSLQNRRMIVNYQCLDLFRRWKTACTTFCKHNAVKRAFQCRNILNGKEISLNFLQNRRFIAIFVCPSLFRRWKTRALRSARTTQCKGRLNVEISQPGEK